MMRRRISRAQQTKNWCVGFSFPPPAYAGIHPTLYLFGFRADALNSHSWAFPVVAFGAPKPSGGLRGLRGAFGGLWCPRFSPLKPFRVPGPRGASGRLRGASRRLRGASAACRGLRGPPRASGLRRLVCGGLDVGFGSGFTLAWQTQKYQHPRDAPARRPGRL